MIDLNKYLYFLIQLHAFGDTWDVPNMERNPIRIAKKILMTAVCQPWVWRLRPQQQPKGACVEKSYKNTAIIKFNFAASGKILIIKYHYSTTSELPELPDFLKPTAKPTQRPLRPISDIDLPDGSFVIQPGEDEGEEETDEDKGL